MSISKTRNIMDMTVRTLEKLQDYIFTEGDASCLTMLVLKPSGVLICKPLPRLQIPAGEIPAFIFKERWHAAIHPFNFGFHVTCCMTFAVSKCVWLHGTLFLDISNRAPVRGCGVG